ncbi:hypothetical protein [Miltoncostaea marina]|uniref:hypothetical protein n=1 Tax=Miltoncostaea marina TaxID=2843215 RepID=UPI001C3E33C4|nr:hypothetical protein [Miltoncostaea marina]
MSAPRIALLAAVAALLAAAPASSLGAGGVPVPASFPAPDGAGALGPLCRADTPAFRLWWSDHPGAPGAVEGADGSCATQPPVVAGLAGAAEAHRATARALGFPAMAGDAAPSIPARPALTRTLLRTGPARRARILAASARAARGGYLASLRPAQRARVLRGVPRRLRARLLADMRRVQRGRPADFVGGDRRVDVVVDGTGATGLVQPGQPGASPCRTTGEGRARFHAAWAVVLAQPGRDPRAVLAHELFHVAQCNLGVGFDAPMLAREGTAEWFASVAEPAAFPGAVASGGGSSSIGGGNARVASFCNGFDPAGTGTTPYASWAVWQALDPAAAPSAAGVRAALLGFRTSTGTRLAGGAAVARVGPARWAEAVRVAAHATCGDLRSPSGTATFDPVVRDFLGALRPPASEASAATLPVAPGGVSSATAAWGSGAAAATVLVSAAGVPAETLAAHVVSGGAEGRIAPVVRGGAVALDVPAAMLAGRSVPVTVANPSAGAPLAAEVRVVVSR